MQAVDNKIIPERCIYNVNYFNSIQLLHIPSFAMLEWVYKILRI